MKSIQCSKCGEMFPQIDNVKFHEIKGQQVCESCVDLMQVEELDEAEVHVLASPTSEFFSETERIERTRDSIRKRYWNLKATESAI